MMGLGNLIKRNIKLFFKDKGMFFTSLITPVILLVLYATFLANVYRDSFVSNIPEMIKIGDSVIDATVGGQLVSSLLAVSCVTVAFCSNLLMVQDKISGARRDIAVTPVRRSTVAVAYFCASAITTMIISLTALGVCLLYLLKTGWYLSAADVLYTVLDVVLLTLFGVALSSCINYPLSTNGQGSAVGTIVSAGYGFICGAYMPISSFGSGLQKVLSFLPSTYMTSLVRNHAMRGALAQMEADGVPKAFVDATRESLDCTVAFAGKTVTIPAMYAYVGGIILILLGAYLAVQYLAERKRIHS